MPTLIGRRASIVAMFVAIAHAMPTMPAPAAAGEREGRCAAAMLLGIVNLSPFHLAHAPPASAGACALAPGATEAIASIDMASHTVGEGVAPRARWLGEGEAFGEFARSPAVGRGKSGA